MNNKRDAEATELAKKTAGHESVRLFLLLHVKENYLAVAILLRMRIAGYWESARISAFALRRIVSTSAPKISRPSAV